jgi:hypothetical protein
LEEVLRAEGNKEFAANLAAIKQELKAEFLEAALGEAASTAYKLQHDNQVKEAIRYLGDAKLFTKVFKKPKDKG